MTAINELTGVDALASGDIIPIYSNSAGGTRSASADVVKAFMAGDTATGWTPLYSGPTASGFSYAFPQGGKNYWLILTPTGAFAAGTLVLPTTAVSMQQICVFTTQAITALTITGSAFGAPTTLAANGFFTLRYDPLLLRWYRIG
jgi:hypothetical protein